MTKKPCKDCGLELESHVKVCPNCHTPQKMGMMKRIAWGVFLGFSLLSIIAMLADGTSKTPEQKAQEDKQMYSEYYRAVMEKTSAADKVSGAFFEAVERGDVITAAQIAMNIKYKMYECQAEINRIDAPDLNNEDARKDLEQAKEAISSAYLNKTSFVSDFIDFAEDQNIKKVAELKNTGDTIQARAMEGLTSLLSAGSRVGVSPPDVAKSN